MAADAFVDTNILLYSISTEPTERPKRDRARQILREEKWAWSVQIASEFYYNATSTRRPFALSPPQASAYVQTWLQFPTASLDPSSVLDAIELQIRFQTSYWDALMLAAALQLGCARLYSEDLNDGQQYDSLKVENPFRSL